MKVSLNTVAQYIDTELPPVEELVEKINSQLGAIEEIIDLAAKYKDAVIVRVVACEKHPDADKLNVCLVDDAGVVADVPRNEAGLVQVVCGAPNARADMWAVWLPPKSTVPASFDDAEPFVLDARKLRGVLSQGMLAAGDELAINSDHDGIIDITERDLPADASIAAGASFAELFGLNDTIIDIENKMFTHRPDLFGQLGVAREISAILQGTPAEGDMADRPFGNPDWYWSVPQFNHAEGLELSVFNDAPENAPRFMAVAMNNVTVGPSPLWLQVELIRWGGRPINNVVDLTNYIMLLTAQPAHAYDYDKLRGRTLGVRMARSGETVTLINDKTYRPDEQDIVIADGEGPVGLAGVMGGGDSEVSANTKNIVLEVATFNMYAVRKSAMRHGVFTDALTRFNKGQSKLQNDRVIGQLMTLIQEHACAQQASEVHDVNDLTSTTDRGTLTGELQVDGRFISSRLGVDLTLDQMASILRRVNFAVYPAEHNETTLCITAPFWRTDIELTEDVVEEVGRLYGYDKLPRELPQRSTKPVSRNTFRVLAETVRQALARAGANEALTYSFVHERVLKTAGQDPDDAFKLANALSPDLQYYRMSITPSLLDKVHGNVRAGYDEFALFEIGKSHSKAAAPGADGLPVEPGRIALTYTSKKAAEGAPYFKAKRLLESVADALGLTVTYKPLPVGSRLVVAAPFADGRTARVIDEVSGQVIGIVGEYSPSVRKGFKLPEYSAGFELLTEGLLLAAAAPRMKYRPLSKYPSVERDVCFEVESDVVYGDVVEALVQSLKQRDIQSQPEPIDIYQFDDKKRITLRIEVLSYEETLTNEAVNTVVEAVATQVAAQIGATII
jgi:phenylalanyl-tRNA synthetase beta chain